jgi:hypothetical protein
MAGGIGVGTRGLTCSGGGALRRGEFFFGFEKNSEKKKKKVTPKPHHDQVPSGQLQARHQGLLVDLVDVARAAARVEAQPALLALRDADAVGEGRQQR